MARLALIVKRVSVKTVRALLQALVTVIKIYYSRVVLTLLTVFRSSITQWARRMAQFACQSRQLLVVTIRTTCIANGVINQLVIRHVRHNRDVDPASCTIKISRSRAYWASIVAICALLSRRIRVIPIWTNAQTTTVCRKVKEPCGTRTRV